MPSAYCEDGGFVVAPAGSLHLFFSLSSMRRVDLSGLDTSRVTDMHRMLDGCSSLASLDLSGLDTSGVTDMGHMFWH